MESLEARCNPAALVPTAEPIIELEPIKLSPVNGNLQIASLTSVAIDPFTPSAPVKPVSLNSFAGQTVNIPIDPRNGNLYVGTDDGVYVGGVGRDVLLGGVGQDQIEQAGGVSRLGSKLLVIQGDGNYVGSGGQGIATGSLSNFKYIEDPSRNSIGGVGQDMLLGGDARDTLERSGTHEVGHTLGFRHEHTRPTSDSGGSVDRTGDGVDDIVVGATINGHVKAFDGARTTKSGSVYTVTFGGSLMGLESIIDDLARDVATANRSGNGASLQLKGDLTINEELLL